MKRSKLLALSAITLLGFSACQKPELESELISGATHTVTFVAGAPETKTTVDISDGTTAKFAWTEYDKSRFTVYENRAAAKETNGILDDTKRKMTLKATFEGTTPENASYVAVVNNSNDLQIMFSEAYAEDADILVSKAVSSFDGENGVQLQFKREVAIAKMTLKGLDAGEVVNHVTVSSIADIAGSYGVDGWNSTTTSLDIYSAKALDDQETYSIVANEAGEAVVWFTCIPQDAATLTVKVKAADGDTYTKEFSRSITLTRGNVTSFGVGMAKLVDPHKNDNGWFLVKDARLLAAGDVIRIGCASAGKVAGALSSAILSSENATYKSEQMVSVSSAEDYTLGGNEGAWTLSSLTGKLGATAVKKLSENEEASDYVGTWTISIDNDGAATIAPKAEGYGRILCNNTAGTERFTTYAFSTNTSASMLLPGIYKKYGTPAEAKKDQTISFDPTSYTATIGKENTYPTLTAQSTGAKTWSSSNTDVATINASTGEISLVAAGTTTISVTVAGDATYNEGKGSYVLTVENAPVVSTATWSLVTDASKLAEGDVIVIVAAGSNVALSTTQNDNNRGQQEITKNADNTVTIDAKVQQLTLGAGTKTGTFSLSTGDGYLYAASSKSNYLKTQTTLDANGSWTITIENNNAIIKAQGANTRNLLKYNSSSSIFSCYSSGQGAVQIYKNDTRAAQSISYSAEKGSIDKYTSDKNIPTLDVSGVKTTVSYTSSDETVATVSGTGEITPLKAGTTTITAIAAASAEYREAKASFVLTVTDSTPYLSAKASKISIDAAGETVTITVDTNVDSWTATSDNADFVVGKPSGNTVNVVVSENKDDSERTAKITVTAGSTLSETITLTQSGASTGGVVGPTDYVENFSTYTNSSNSNTAVIEEFDGDACKWSGVGATTLYYTNTNNNDGTTGVTLLKPAAADTPTYIISEKLQKGVSKLEITAHSNNTSASLKVYVVTSTEEKLLGEVKTTAKKTNFTESFAVDVTGEYQIKVVNDNTVAYINFTGLKWTSAN